MAKILFGPLIAEARGQIGGIVFSRNTHGPYVRENFSPVNPNTERQQSIRSALTLASTAWRDTLDFSMRAEWDQYAKNTPVVDKFGKAGYLTGFQQYVGHQVIASMLGLPALTLSPLGFGHAVKPSLVTSDIATCHDNQKVNIVAATFVDNYDPALADVHTLVFQGKAISPGKSYYNGPYRYVGVVELASVYPLCLDAAYPIPAANSIVSVKFVHYDAFGRLSDASSVFTTPSECCTPGP